MSEAGAIRQLVRQLDQGHISRRNFMQAATALGIGVSTATVIANGVGAQDATPESATNLIPDTGTAEQTRGAGGELRIIQSQAPSVLAAHSSTGSKDTYVGGLVLEPLLTYLKDGSLAPVLAAAVPSVEDGTISEDLKTVTFSLKEGVVWSDGEPFTANDVVFTWQWITNADNASVNQDTWGLIANAEATDDHTVVITFTDPQVAWFEAFVGVDTGIVYPAHAFNNDPANKNDAFLSQPIGTGPFKVDSFSPNDAAQLSANENYREPTKPFFATVSLKGGGDAISAGRAVVQTGDYDYAWNVQAEPEIIQDLIDNGTTGKILRTVDTTVEGFHINFSDPNQEVDGERSQKDTPHPFFTDIAVRQALNLAIDRTLISEKFYGDGELAEVNALAGNPFFISPNTTWTFDLDQAAQVLEDAGWVKNGDVREKDGVQLKLVYAAPTNSVRQKTQAVVKKDLESIGFKVELVNVDPNFFFGGSSSGTDQDIQHFYWDLAVWSSGPPSSIPVSWLSQWYAGPDGENISQQSNGWAKANVQRWNNPEYDELYLKLQSAKTLEEAQGILIEINDHVIEQVAFVPIVLRPFFNAISNRLREENIANDNGFASPYWNIANWNAVE